MVNVWRLHSEAPSPNISFTAGCFKEVKSDVKSDVIHGGSQLADRVTEGPEVELGEHAVGILTRHHTHAYRTQIQAKPSLKHDLGAIKIRHSP